MNRPTRAERIDRRLELGAALITELSINGRELWRNGWGSWHVFTRLSDPIGSPLNTNRHAHDRLASVCGRHEFYFDEPTVLVYRQWRVEERLPSQASVCRTCMQRLVAPR